MTERELQILGFEKEYEYGDDPEYYYYYYEITSGLGLMSNASDEVKDNQWFVEIFNTEDPIRFCQMEKVQSLINTLESAKVKVD